MIFVIIGFLLGCLLLGIFAGAVLAVIVHNKKVKAKSEADKNNLMYGAR